MVDHLLYIHKVLLLLEFVRRRFEEMGVIQFEDWEDTGAEYIKFELGADVAPPATA